MKKLWTDNLSGPQYPQLKENIDTEVLVIGGGMAGILTAYFLDQNGVMCVVAESDRIGSGTTSRTTAVLSAQHDTLYTQLAKLYGESYARGYLEANLDAVHTFESFAQTVNCDFEKKTSYMYSATDGEKMKNEANFLNRLGFPAEFTEKVPIPVSIKGAVAFPGMAQFHPLKFLYGISKKLHIYEKTTVRKVKDNIAYTDFGKIKAKAIVVASHFPIINTRGLYFAKMYQQRSYVIAIDNVPPLDCTLIDDAENGMYFRTYKNLLLIGGGDHRTGETGGGYKELRRFISQHYPNSKERFYWSSQDCITLDGAPYIGKYSRYSDNLYTAAGFNLWGMTSSMVASKLLGDRIAGKANRYAAVFSPQRSMMHGQLFLNMGTTVLNFVNPTLKRCSHMGCTLKWNRAEHSWDCPCHGSRFDEKGAVLDNPAIKNANV